MSESLAAKIGRGERVGKLDVMDRLLQARAVIDTYIESLHVERGAEDRYVLWTVQEMLKDATDAVERDLDTEVQS
ncbi:MAG TPA: hypothetical protein VGC34_14985 [Steroidobacteraceae bacterium]